MARFGRRQPHAPIVLRGLPTPQPPIGRVPVFGQRTSQHAVERFFHRSFQPIIKKAGGSPIVGRSLVYQKIAGTASRRPHFGIVILAPRVLAPSATSPIGRTLIAGQKTSQAASDCFCRRSFLPIVKKAGGSAIVGEAVIVSQATRTAWDRFYRRSFSPIVKRAGGQPAISRLFFVKAQTIYRQSRRPVYISPSRPVAPSTPPIGRLILRAAKFQEQRFFRRSFPPIIKTRGSPPAAGRQLVVLKLAQITARRPGRKGIWQTPPPLRPQPVTQPPIGKLLTLQKIAQIAARRPVFRVQRIVPTVPIGPPVPVAHLPLLLRVPNVSTPDGIRRLRRFTEILSSIINSLTRKGRLIQTGPEEWDIVP